MGWGGIAGSCPMCECLYQDEYACRMTIADERL